MTSPHDEALAQQYADASMPPAAIASERILLGAALYHGTSILRPLTVEDFYYPWHQELFTLIIDAHANRPHVERLDIYAIKDEILRRGKASRLTDVIFMWDEAIAGAVSRVSARYHVERILETVEARLVQTYGQRLTQLGDDTERADEVAAEMREKIADVRRRLDGDTATRDTTRLDNLVRLNKLAAATSPPAMSTGLPDLDRALNGGLRPSTFNVLGARPGVGKSMLAGGIALHMGRTGSARVLYVTMELSAGEVTNRMLSNLAGVELTRLQNPKLLTDPDLIAIDDAEDRLSGWPIHVIDGGRTIDQVEAAARAYLGDVPAGLLVVDYLGRIREDGSATTRERHISLCSSRLTDLSRELRIPVLCVVSFSRNSVRRGDAPRMDDIRDSGTVESDADTVMLLWQPSAEDEAAIEVVVDKNRYGAVTTVPLVKQGHRGRMVSSGLHVVRGA